MLMRLETGGDNASLLDSQTSPHLSRPSLPPGQLQDMPLSPLSRGTLPPSSFPEPMRLRLGSVERYSGESGRSLELDDGPGTDLEKRMRREIANSNERRRMQSINVGFQSLRALLPKRDGEKMSKASILQQTADYVVTLEKEKERLIRENLEYKSMLDSRGERPVSNPSTTSLSPAHPTILAPPKKRRRYEQPAATINTDSSSSDEGGTASTADPASPQYQAQHSPQKDADDIRAALDREVATRKMLEDQLRSIELSRLQSFSRLQPGLIDYSQLLNPYSLGLLPPPPQQQHHKHESLLTTTIAHPAPIKPTLLLGGTSSLSPNTVNSFYNSLLATSTGPTPLHIPTVPAPPTSSLCNSKQSLEVIVEAIRHLEGDSGWAEPKMAAFSPQRPEFASPLGRAPVIVPN